jgi:hypothetical protein
LSSERIEKLRRQLSHVSKHSRTVVADQVEVRTSREANIEKVGHDNFF